MTAYEQACAAKCKWCAEGYRRIEDTTMLKLYGCLFWHVNNDAILGDMFQCTAPTKEQFMEQQSALIALVADKLQEAGGTLDHKLTHQIIMDLQQDIRQGSANAYQYWIDEREQQAARLEQLETRTTAQSARIRELEDAIIKQSDHFHGKPCYFCNQPINSLAGDPGKWGIPLCHEDEPGVVKAHHIGCVASRLALVKELVGALEVAKTMIQSWDSQCLADFKLGLDRIDAALEKAKEFK